MESGHGVIDELGEREQAELPGGCGLSPHPHPITGPEAICILTSHGHLRWVLTWVTLGPQSWKATAGLLGLSLLLSGLAEAGCSWL